MYDFKRVSTLTHYTHTYTHNVLNIFALEKLLGHRIEAHWRAPCPIEVLNQFLAPPRLTDRVTQLLRTKSKADNDEEEDILTLCSERVRQL